VETGLEGIPKDRKMARVIGTRKVENIVLRTYFPDIE